MPRGTPKWLSWRPVGADEVVVEVEWDGVPYWGIIHASSSSVEELVASWRPMSDEGRGHFSAAVTQAAAALEQEAAQAEQQQQHGVGG